MEKYRTLVLCLMFLVVIFGIGIGTIQNGSTELLGMLDKDAAQHEELSVSSFESLLKEKLAWKDSLIALSGAVEKLMGRHLVGEGEFFQDLDGLMHLKRRPQDNSRIIDSACYLEKVLSDREIPYMVCQTAERAAYGDRYSAQIDQSSLEYIDPLKQRLSETDAVYFDYKDSFDEAGYCSKDIFFKTDIHYTTKAEFFILSRIIDVLEKEVGLTFPNKSTVLDLDNYSIENYPFWGNLCNSVGRIYAGTDMFQYYIPQFDTSMTMNNPSASIQRNGSFEAVCLNGYRGRVQSNMRLYYVTDYLQYPSPYYRITNDLVEDNDILVIGCSMSMRTTAYLTLLCRSVTVLDPRSFSGVDYLEKALQDDYDAVILFPSANLLGGIGGYIENQEREETSDNSTIVEE